MAQFYFFTDLDLLNTQTATDAFGPLTALGGKDWYQVTSLHAATSDPKAYAVCDGIVFIQEDSGNSSLVNLILKPMSQPPFAFPKVKFFIYRGIKKDSLINVLEIAIRTSNDLTESIWASQEARNASAETTDNPPEEALGTDIVDPAYPDTDSIESIFYRADVVYQFPVVRAGWSIGEFDGAGFGFEIMVESIGFDPALAKVRNDKNIIEVDTLPGSPTQPQEFEHWHDKEVILNYIDPCAFYGSFYHKKIKVKSSDDSSNKKNGNEIYDDVLIKFFNKNITYLDIRNEYNFSFNYFKNYGSNIKIAYDGTSTLVNWNYHASGWPILSIANTEFPTTNTSSNENMIRISMPDGSGDNPLPLMFISAGYLDSDYPREPKDKNKMIDLTVINGYTDEVKLGSANREGLSNTTAVSSYIKLKYFKRFDPEAETPPVSSGTVIRAGNFMDHLFAPYSMKIPFGGTTNLKVVVFDEEMFVDAKKELGVDYVAKVGNSDDEINYVFFAFPDILRKEGKTISEPFSFVSEINNSAEDFFELITLKINNKRIKKSNFELSPDVEYLEIENVDEVVDGFKNLSTDELITIGILKFDLDSISLTDFQTKYRIYIGFTNKVIDSDEIGQAYTAFDIALRGFEINSGTLQFKELITTLKIYYHGDNV